ncbi:MAG: hypothetical protein ABI266_09620 [Ginsengibacter sp.]
MKKDKLPSFTTCIIFDLIGYASYIIPGFGELFDLIWAPVSGIVFFFLFGKNKFGLFGGAFAFLEELSPGLDLIPTFTIAWFIRSRELQSENEKMKQVVSR